MRTHFLVCALLALLPCTLVHAEPAKAVISGPTGGVPGDLIVLDANGSTADFYSWNVLPQLSGGRQTIVTVENGRKAFLASVPGQYTVILSVANSEGIDVLLYRVNITNDGTPPQPPQPNPQPQPQPAPVGPTFPNSQYGISKIVFESAKTINNKMEARALAEGYRSITAKIRAGGLKGKEAIFTDIKAANNAALPTPESVAAWKPLLAIELAKQFQRLDQLKQLNSDLVYAAIFTEVAVGLEAFCAL